MNKAFLCREALEQLGIISKNFPEISADHTFNLSTEPGSSCNCPRRVKEIPSMPQELPDGLTGREEDVPALKEWLLQYYGSTAFNVCEHQPLPLMNCEPLKLYLNENAKPVAVHKKHSFRHANGLTFALETALRSTQRSSNLHWTLLNSQGSPLQAKTSNLTRNSLTPYSIFLHQRIYQEPVLGLVWSIKELMLSPWPRP